MIKGSLKKIVSVCQKSSAIMKVGNNTCAVTTHYQQFMSYISDLYHQSFLKKPSPKLTKMRIPAMLLMSQLWAPKKLPAIKFHAHLHEREREREQLQIKRPISSSLNIFTLFSPEIVYYNILQQQIYFLVGTVGPSTRLSPTHRDSFFYFHFPFQQHRL